MKLHTLLNPFVQTEFNWLNIEVTGLENDSRRVKPGDAFIAYPGAITDGREYIEAAIKKGAVAICYEPNAFVLPTHLQRESVPCIAFPKISEQLAVIAARYYENPSQALSITGVTGTNGKTTIAYQLAQAYSILGQRSVYLGTLGQGDVKTLNPLMNTTPDALCLQQLLHQYARNGIEQVCMEVSSHALSLGRVDCIDFNQAIYTNLTHDHLDFHHTMEAYAQAKASLFSKPTLKYAIINRDDAYSSLMQQAVHPHCTSLHYGIEHKTDVFALHWETHMSGSQVEVLSPWGQYSLQLQSLGRFNIYNSLAVFTSLMASGLASAQEVTHLMSQLRPSPGRMEIVAQRPCVVVDYAHTPDALENVLMTLKQLKPQKLWVVFGCGGNRDRTKRPIMGQIADRYADQVILTNDNPRQEDPDAILQDILHGIIEQSSVQTITDRREAIEFALCHAKEKDIVLIAGKGHENYQLIGSQRLDFSDQLTVRALLKGSHSRP